MYLFCATHAGESKEGQSGPFLRDDVISLEATTKMEVNAEPPKEEDEVGVQPPTVAPSTGTPKSVEKKPAKPKWFKM